MTQENVILPRLNTIEACYTSTYDRYKDSVEDYEVEIEKININSKENKGMVIKVTDKRLLSKAGGIVQGMSGSPVMQNNKIIGAVTHVFVNDSTRGYGIFIEDMLSE